MKNKNNLDKKPKYTIMTSSIICMIVIFCFLIGASAFLCAGKEYIAWAMIFIVLMCASGIALAFLMPKLLKEAAQNELLSYDFDYKSVQDKDEFVFEQKECIKIYNTQKDPLIDGEHKTFDNAEDLINYLRSNPDIGSPQKLKQTKNESPVNVFDGTQTGKYTRFEVNKEQSPDGKFQLKVFSDYRIVFDDSGISLNGFLFPYSSVIAVIDIYVYHRVYVKIRFHFESVGKLTITLKCDKTTIHLVKKYGIFVDNPHLLNALITDPIGLFTTTLKQSTKNT